MKLTFAALLAVLVVSLLGCSGESQTSDPQTAGTIVTPTNVPVSTVVGTKPDNSESSTGDAVSYTHLTLPTILLV